MRLLLVVTSSALLVLLPARARAYVDPSAGSLLLQALLGGAAGIAVALKLGGRRLWSRLRGRRDGDEPAPAPGEPRR